KASPVLWAPGSTERLGGPASATALDRLNTLFQQTFGQNLEPLTAGRQAFLLAQPRQQTRGVDDASPSAFVPGLAAEQVAWSPDEGSRDFLGNEFLLWLWFMLDAENDTLTLSAGAQAAVMRARTRAVECPRAQTGKEPISSDAPTRLPEARRAVQAGKLPRRVGMVVVRHDQQYELTLQGESLAVGGARLPAPEAL